MTGESSVISGRQMGPILVFAGTLFAIGFAIIVIPISRGSPAQTHLLNSYEFHFVLWLVIVLGQFVLWGYLLPDVGMCVLRKLPWGPLASDDSIPASCLKDLGFTLVFFVAVVGGGSALAITRGPQAAFLPNYQLQVGTTTAMGLAIAMIAAAGMWMTAYQLRAITDGATNGYTHGDVATYLSLRADIQICLYALGLILTGAVLGAAASRGVTLALDKSATFDITGVLLYGTYFSAVLAFAYLPVHATMLSVGAAIRDGVLPPMPDVRASDGRLDERWGAWIAARSSLDDLLQLKVSANTSLQAAVLILAPLLGSLVTGLFSTKAS